MQVNVLIILHIFTIVYSANISHEKKHNDNKDYVITLNTFRSLYNSKYIKIEVNGKNISMYLDLKEGSLNNIYEKGIEPPFTIRLTNSLSKITKANFTFFFSQRNSISLSPTNYSFVHFLYNQGLIYSKRFLIHKKYTNVSFGFDNEWFFMKESICKMKFYPEISNDFWEITIKTINDFSRNKIYLVNKKGYIHTDDDFIIIDKDTFIWLKEDYFYSYLNNNTCYYVTFKTGFNRHEHVIECNYSIIPFLPNITLIINSNYKVLYVPYDNFECFVEGCFFNMIYDSNSNSSEWKLGNSFINRYYALFNFDDYSITLYNDDYKCDYMNDVKIFVLKMILLSIGVAIVFEIFVKIKYL